MPYDLELEKRIDSLSPLIKGCTKKKMFGGVCYLLNGNMCIGIHKESLMVRVPPEQTDELLKNKNVNVFDLTGKPMKGWLLVGKKGISDDESLSKWILMSKEFVRKLPKK